MFYSSIHAGVIEAIRPRFERERFMSSSIIPRLQPGKLRTTTSCRTSLRGAWQRMTHFPESSRKGRLAWPIICKQISYRVIGVNIFPVVKIFLFPNELENGTTNTSNYSWHTFESIQLQRAVTQVNFLIQTGQSLMQGLPLFLHGLQQQAAQDLRTTTAAMVSYRHCFTCE